MSKTWLAVGAVLVVVVVAVSVGIEGSVRYPRCHAPPMARPRMNPPMTHGARSVIVRQ